MSTAITGESPSSGSVRTKCRPGTRRLASSFVRNRCALRASLAAAAAYEAARTPAARRAVLTQFEANLSDQLAQEQLARRPQLASRSGSA